MGGTQQSGPDEDSTKVRSLRLRADGASAKLARDTVCRWLLAWLWPADQVIDIVIALNETLSNCIAHAGLTQGADGAIEVQAEVRHDDSRTTRRLTLTVSDTGRWQPKAARRRPQGLHLMLGCMDTVVFNRTEHGTVVTLLSTAVPATAV